MTTKLSEETLGQRIKVQRMKMRMTQEELAEIMCVPKSTVSAYENDKVDIKGSVLIELSNVLYTTPNYLLGYGDTTNVDDEAEAMNDVVSSIFNRIKDEKVKELIIAQMKVASNMYA